MSATAEMSAEVNGTHLYVERRGAGPPLLLIHGGGEDAGMLAAQAESLAQAGFEVVTYDRRGTGRSGRDAWPGKGAEQHADDAAALVAELGRGPATVVGVSSGAVVGIKLVTCHPAIAERVVAWEPPAVGILADGAAISAAIMAPVDTHLAEHPGDFVGAQAILLSAILGFPVSTDDPAFEATRANAEPMVRDEPAITLEPFSANDLAVGDITIAVGLAPNDLIAVATSRLAEWTGRDPLRVDADHEVYLSDPRVLTDIVTATCPTSR